MSIICWFRRDLRVADNTALFHAARDAEDGIIPVFVFDDAILRHPDCGAPIVTFMLGCLAELQANLRQAGGDLVFMHGQPLDELRNLARKTGAKAIYYNKDYDPAAIARDEDVAAELAKDGVVVKGFKDQVIFEQSEIVTASSGQPYTVYSPYKRAWLARFAERQANGEASLPLPGVNLKFPDVQKKSVSHGTPANSARRQSPAASNGAVSSNSLGIGLPAPKDLGFAPFAGIEIPAGESAAAKMLADFCAAPIASYKKDRNFPAIRGVSRLSAHLRHGTLSPRQVLHAAARAKQSGGAKFNEGVDCYIGEIIWREFYQQMLFNFPHVVDDTFKRDMSRLEWRHDEALFDKWKSGQTGFPIVDAGMRQLNRTGWMHNRLRMIVAMFLTKDLLIDYKWGERYFANLLIDFEVAQNNGGWQWSASTGADAQPYFRIFNPTTQSQTCDPDGAFIRTYCPELAKVPTEFIHAPHEMPPLLQEAVGCRIGRDYPAPIADHAEARQEALKMFGAAKGK